MKIDPPKKHPPRYEAAYSDDEETPAIVIDLGSYMTRIGLSDGDSPSYVFPTVVGKPKDKSLKFYICNEFE